MKRKLDHCETKSMEILFWNVHRKFSLNTNKNSRNKWSIVYDEERDYGKLATFLKYSNYSEESTVVDFNVIAWLSF